MRSRSGALRALLWLGATKKTKMPSIGGPAIVDFKRPAGGRTADVQRVPAADNWVEPRRATRVRSVRDRATTPRSIRDTSPLDGIDAQRSKASPACKFSLVRFPGPRPAIPPTARTWASPACMLYKQDACARAASPRSCSSHRAAHRATRPPTGAGSSG